MNKPIIVYKEDTGEVVGYGYIKNPSPKPGEVFEEAIDDPSVVGKIRVSKDKFREKTAEEKEASIPNDKKRLAELSAKKTDLTLEEINEVLRLKGII